MKTIAVTGATGNVAGGTIQALQGKGVKLRAIVRNKEKAKPLEAAGVEVRVGDLERPRSLAGLFEGADATFITVPAGPRAPEQASNALWAARQGGVKHVVRLSAFGAAHDAPTVNSRLHALSDAELTHSGLKYTILKPHFYMQNLMGSAASIKGKGAFYWAMGSGKVGLIDTRDICEVAAHVLTTSGHDNKTYTLTGPTSIDMNAVAAALGRALGKPLRYVAIPLEAQDQALFSVGLDEWMVTMFGDYMNAYSRNWGDTTTDEVPRLLGRPARSIDDFARDFAAVFR